MEDPKRSQALSTTLFLLVQSEFGFTFSWLQNIYPIFEILDTGTPLDCFYGTIYEASALPSW